MIPSIKILAIDDHPLYMAGIAACLKKMPGVAFVDTCSTYDDMQQKIKNDTPHLVFLELNLNGSRVDGFAICREITSRYKNVFVAVLSRYNNVRLIRQARDCGARAYFDKGTDTETLHAFLQEFRRGNVEPYYVRVCSTPKPSAAFEPEVFEMKYELTKREREIMNLIVEGKEHGEIEASFFISYETYRTHHKNILRKLGLKNDVELTRFALRNNLCEPLFSNSPFPATGFATPPSKN